MKELLNTLVTAFGPSGREEAVARVIAQAAKPFGEVWTDAMGNLIVHKPGTGKRVMVAAHMDCIGIVATFVDKDGFVRFGDLGGLRLAALLGQRVRFSSGAVGVVCADGGVEPGDLSVGNMYVDVMGQEVQPGDAAVVVGAPVYGGELVLSPYLDNRIGCAIALKALELAKDSENDLYFVFTTQEEVGMRGAKPAAYTVDPELAIAVDVCGTGDTPEAKEKTAVKVGGGPVVKYMDRAIICHKSVVDAMLQAGEDLGVKCQKYVAASGGTDAGAMHQTRSGVPTGILSIATRYIHTPGEVCSMRDAEECAKLLAKVVSQ